MRPRNENWRNIQKFWIFHDFQLISLIIDFFARFEHFWESADCFRVLFFRSWRQKIYVSAPWKHSGWKLRPNSVAGGSCIVANLADFQTFGSKSVHLFAHFRDFLGFARNTIVFAIACKAGNLPIGIISARKSILGSFPPPRSATLAECETGTNSSQFRLEIKNMLKMAIRRRKWVSLESSRNEI